MSDDQIGLFEEESAWQPVRIGHAEVTYKPTASILTRATGFMSDYDFTLNPYAGCSFGCTYCYAAFFVREEELRDRWGYWVQVKEGALERLRRTRISLKGKSIYLSSVTDPYQPIERQLKLVRGLLEELVHHQPRLVVQTRSTLVVRDVDLLQRFEHVRVNMTVTSDSEKIRRVFEPFCPTTERRLDAIRKVSEAGVPACITMTPLLPLEDAGTFVERLLTTGVRRFVVQPFHSKRGNFVAGTRSEAEKLIKDFDWNDASYRRAVDLMRSKLPHLDEGKAGFTPE